MKKTKAYFTTLFFILFQPVYASSTAGECSIPDGINVNIATHMLTICSDNHVVKEFPVALGRNGFGKKNRDDKKTPIGLYGLEHPRQSEKFGTFIPIQYPTPAQRLAGFTGSDVGIHGPIQKHNWFTWLNKTTTSVDWTFGCIAVETNSQINYIADWLKKHPQSRVIIS